MSRFMLRIGASIAALGSTALADDLAVAMPDTHTGDTTPALAVKAVIEGLKSSDRFTLMSATSGHTLASIEVGPEKRYDRKGYVAKIYDSQINEIRRHVEGVFRQEAKTITDQRVDLPGLFENTGQSRRGKSDPQFLLQFGNALYIDDHDTAVSMLREDGTVQFPRDGMLELGNDVAVYGTGPQKNPLAGVTVYFCASFPEHVTRVERQAIARVWAHMIARDGGVLATFTEDTAQCMADFNARITTPLSVTPFDESAPAEMVSYVRGGEIAQDTLSPRETGGSRLTKKDERIAVLEADVLAAEDELQRLNAKVETARRSLQQKDDALGTADRKITTLNRQITDAKKQLGTAETELAAVKKAILGSADDRMKGVTTFTRFFSQSHPEQKAVTITTGVEYRLADFPKYSKSYCYVYRKTRSGSTIRVDLGSKRPSQSIRLEAASDHELADGQMSKQFFERAQSACSFPAE